MRFLIIGIWVVVSVCAASCMASSDYTVRAYGKSVVAQHYDTNPFAARASASVDLTATCDQCKKDFPTEGKLSPFCMRPCGYGYSGYGATGVAITPGEAAMYRMQGGSAVVLSAPAVSASASGVPVASQPDIRPLVKQTARNAQDVCDIKRLLNMPDANCSAKSK